MKETNLSEASLKGELARTALQLNPMWRRPGIEESAKIYAHNTVLIDLEDDPYAYGFQVI